MTPALSLLIKRLSSVEEQIRQVYEEDEVFRDLCEDYLACTLTVDRMQATGTAGEPIRTEYVALQLRLEGEVLRYLAERQAP
jgi:hypothetical protein